MNIQRIILTRVETIEIAVPFAIDVDTRENIEAAINSPVTGNLGDARLIPVLRSVSAWKAEKSDPAFRKVLGEPTGLVVKPSRKTKGR